MTMQMKQAGTQFACVCVCVCLCVCVSVCADYVKSLLEGVDSTPQSARISYSVTGSSSCAVHLALHLLLY